MFHLQVNLIVILIRYHVNTKMPVKKITINHMQGFRYGTTGKFYPVKKYGEKGSEEKAKKQGAAIHISEARAKGEYIPSKSVQVKSSGRAKGYERRV